MHEWMTDNGLTPLLLVDAGVEGVEVPREYVRDGRIVLNASYSATAGLSIKNDWITFSARFNRANFEVRLPVLSVLGIYAREFRQEEMTFSTGESTPDPPTPPTKPGGDEPRRPQLKVVK